MPRKSSAIRLFTIGFSTAGAVLGMAGCGPSDPFQPTVSQYSVEQQQAFGTEAECAAQWGKENCSPHPDGQQALAQELAGAESAASGAQFNPNGFNGAGSGHAVTPGAHSALMYGPWFGPRYFFDHSTGTANMIRRDGTVVPVPASASALARSTAQSAPRAGAYGTSRGGFGATASARAGSSGG